MLIYALKSCIDTLNIMDIIVCQHLFPFSATWHVHTAAERRLIAYTSTSSAREEDAATSCLLTANHRRYDPQLD